MEFSVSTLLCGMLGLQELSLPSSSSESEGKDETDLLVFNKM